MCKLWDRWGARFEKKRDRKIPVTLDAPETEKPGATGEPIWAPAWQSNIYVYSHAVLPLDDERYLTCRPSTVSW